VTATQSGLSGDDLRVQLAARRRLPSEARRARWILGQLDLAGFSL
jgi:hypothetical protein